MDELICQSCGMPLREGLYGIDKGGKENKKYCKYCYENGDFTFTGTMDEMAELCAEYEIEKFPDKEKSLEYMRSILPRLERWK